MTEHNGMIKLNQTNIQEGTIIVILNTKTTVSTETTTITTVITIITIITIVTITNNKIELQIRTIRGNYVSTTEPTVKEHGHALVIHAQWST